MTVFATDGQLRKRHFVEAPVCVRNRLRPAAMAENASRQNGAAEGVVCKFVPWRRSPSHRLGIQGQRSLKQVVAPLHDRSDYVCSRSDNPLQLVRIPEGFLCFCGCTGFGLIQVPVFGIGEFRLAS